MMAADVDQFRGVLLGCAVGDALGAPVEGWSRDEISLVYGGPLRDFRPGRYGLGAFTDDTQLTLALTEALVARGYFDMDEVARAFGNWMRLRDEQGWESRGFDRDSAIACRRLYNGVPRQLSAVDSAGSGAASRAAPVGLFPHGTGAVVDAAVLQAMLTHAHPQALAGAAAVGVAISQALSAIPFDAREFLRATALAVEDVEPGLAARVSSLEAYLGLPLDVGLGYTGTAVRAMEAVPAALLIFARTPHHTEEAIVTAVNAGGDTTGIGAMVGALAGALNGSSSLPGRWLAHLESKEHIENLAEALYRVVWGTNGRMTG
jgi:ADP-ribosylglycohydrolase